MPKVDWEYTSGCVPTWRKGSVTIAQMRDPVTCREDALHVYWNGRKLFVCLNDFDHALVRLAHYAQQVREGKV